MYKQFAGLGVIMTITMLNNVLNNETWVNPETEKPNYLRLFEERLERLAPLP